MRPRALLPFLAVWLLALTPLTAQEARPGRLESPRATMFAFLDAIRGVREGDTGRWGEVEACLDLAGAGLAPGAQASREAAHDLWRALNHIRLVREEELPGRDQLAGRTEFVYFPRAFHDEDERLRGRADLGDERIELARGPDGAWRFSARTVADAGRLADALGALERKVDADESALVDPPLLRRYMPSLLVEMDVLEVEIWQWLGLLVLAFLGMLVDQLVRQLLRAGVRLLTRRAPGSFEDRTLTRLARPVGLLAAGLAWLALLRFLGLPQTAELVLLTAVRTFTVLAGTWAAWRLADLAGEVLMHQARATSSRFDDVLVPLLRKTAKIVATAFGLVYGAQSLQIDVVPLITGLGIGGLAFAFAAKDTIENFFGSVAVILDRPFEVGDWVVIGDIEGTVEELGFRSTRIRTFYNSQVTVPNATLVRATVDNYGRRKYRRWKTMVGVQYDTRPEQLIAFTEGIRELVRTHPFTRKDYYHVWCNGFGASSIDILLYVFHSVPDWSTELRERERMLIDIVRLADKLGVQFAFPTQTVHLYREEHADYQRRHAAPESMSDRRALVQGLRAAQEITANQPWRKEKPAGVVFQSGPTSASDLESLDFSEATEDTRSS